MKYIGLAVVLALFLATGVGCNAMQQMEGGGNEENSDKPYVAVIAKGFQHKFWQTVKKGAEQAAKDLDIRITFEGPDTEAQVDKQVEMLDAAISKNPVAICIAALDSRALLGSLDKAAERGIALVGFDSGVDSDLLVATAATDNTAAAALAADKLAEAIGEEGKVGMVVHDQVSTTGRQRRDGFRERIESTYPNIEIVDIQYGEGDHTQSADVAKAMITANSDLKAIYGSNEGSAIGVMLAVEELNKVGKIQVVGFDSGKKQVDSIRNGDMLGAVTQNPIQLGYKAVEAAYRASRGETVQKEIDTGFEWYDKNNVDSDVIKPLLYD
ncbi:MAG: BMP family ABC transporter substrate-binding protein [Ruminococcaceae bacterium]|nr:BMP family ABC transporter substrate-binding protein [Oscillospiraceae bacterium]